MKRPTSGQAVLIVILILGSIMALVVFFGAKRQEDLGVVLSKLMNSQAAQEVLAAAAKRVQVIYSSEAGCDPEVLDSRLSRLSSVDSSAATYGVGMSFAIAQPSLTSSASGRVNRCTNSSGCRQFAIPFENKVFIVTVGKVIAEEKEIGATCTDGTPKPQQCPRDVIVRLSVAIDGTVYFQRFSLINICTFKSCSCLETSTNTDDFTGIVAQATGSYVTQTLACTGGNTGVEARFHGSIVSTTNSDISVDDIRWGRRYLESGGSSIGDTSYMDRDGAGTTTGNGSCAPADSQGQCIRNCVPAFDLNRDRVNNEIDLAILESFMRGLTPSLSPSRLDPTL